MTGASLAVQALVTAALTTALADSITGVFDWVAPDARAPYLTVGADAVTDWSHKTGTGHEHRVQVSVWDDRPGTARLKALADVVETALRGLAGDHDGHRVAGVTFARAVFVKDPNGWSQAAIDFRIRTEAL